MTSIDIQTVEFLKALPFFAKLPARALETFFESASLHTCRKHENLFYQGAVADHFYVVIEGWIKLYRETLDGDEAVVSVYASGDIFGEAVIFSGETYPFAAASAEDSVIVKIPAGVLRHQAAEHPEIMTRIVTLISRELYNVQMENEHLSLMSASQRVGCLLLQLSAGVAGEGGVFSFPYDKALAASRLGMKAETFSRALSQLKPLGVSVHGPEIEIASFSRLMEYTCQNCSSSPGECTGSCRNACCEAA